MEPTQPTNRLAGEGSPYQQQHANNPVDLYPWGEEAFSAAREANKPIFLSIGYSTCHWCHVMAHESFEDSTVARLLNEAFINIKVDREERPDIDHIYMTVCQMMTGSGGWPLTIIMTPEGEPFFAATYIPKETRFGRTGLLDLVPRIKDAWETDRARIQGATETVIAALEQTGNTSPGTEPGLESIKTAFTQFVGRFDSANGGFGTKPKFPTPHQLLFLLRYHYRTGERQALEMVEQTLTAMRLGGIYDHVGFGFHRYSTDERWLVPHFEKMLYDQAMLMMAFTEARLATGREDFAATVDEIADYVLRDLTSEDGAFYSAEDADSEGEEGKFYLWTMVELAKVLNQDELAFVKEHFSLSPDGNYHDETDGQPTGRNILHLKAPMNAAQAERWQPLRERLLAARGQRIRPMRDDKVLTDWNGLMISALARAGQALDNTGYIDAAETAAGFILDVLATSDGRLLHRHRNGASGIPGNVDDYAFMIAALLDLYEATFNVHYLEIAIRLQAVLDEHFRDAESGGYYFTADDSEQLLIRSKQIYDGAVPSGNSVAALNLVRLGRITGNPAYEETTAALLRSFARQVKAAPTGHSLLLCAVDFAVGASYEVVIAGDRDAPDTRKMLAALRAVYHPNKVVLLHPIGDAEAEIVGIAPFLAAQTALNGQATAYVCRNYACQLPTNEIKVMLAALEEGGQVNR